MTKSCYLIIFICSFTTLKSQSYRDIFNPLDSLDSLDSYLLYQKLSIVKEEQTNYKNAYTHKLDSIITGLTGSESKFEYIFDPNRTVILRFDIDPGTNSWIPYSFVLYKYNNSNLLIQQLHSLWNGDINNLDESNPTVFRTFEYNEMDQLIEFRSSGADILGSNNTNIHKYSYNDWKLLDSDSLFRWSAVEEEFKLQELKKFNHDSIGKLTNIVRSEYENEPEGRVRDSISYVYRDDGLLKTRSKFVLNDHDTFELCYTAEYFFHEDGRRDYIIESPHHDLKFYDPATIQYEYHSYGILDRVYSYHEDPTDELFPFTSLESKTYWYDENVLSEKIFYDGNKFSGNLFDQSHYYENHMLTKVLTEEYNFGSWPAGTIVTDISNYYYSTLSTSTINFNEDKNVGIIYPNPGSDFIQVISFYDTTNSKILVHNIEGQLVLEKELYSNQKISISHLPPGIYFYSISNSSSNASGKFVVKR